MNIKESLELMNWAIQCSSETFKTPVCIAICDANGELLLFSRMDEAPARTINIAQAKVYTAARMSMSTISFNERLERESLATSDFMDDKLCSLPGGVPLLKDGKTVAAVGISGLSLENDHALASLIAQQFIS